MRLDKSQRDGQQIPMRLYHHFENRYMNLAGEEKGTDADTKTYVIFTHIKEV